MLLSILVITVFAFMFLLAFYILFIAHNNTNDNHVYGQESDKFPHHFDYNEYHSEPKKDSDVQFVDMPLNITILEHESNRTNKSININSNATKSSNLTS
jgi:hypothetical protein